MQRPYVHRYSYTRTRRGAQTILGGALSALWMPRRVFERPYTDSVHGVVWAVASTLVCRALQWCW